MEGFSQKRKFVVKNNNELYDDFYCSVYDQLLYDTHKNDFEVSQIHDICKIDETSNVLDLGCGKGHYVNFYNKNVASCEGLDKSKAMIKSCRKAYPSCKFKLGKIENGMLYGPDTFF